MKKALITLSLMMLTAVAMAVPARKNVTRTIRLADGTELKAQLVGDEHGHYWLGSDGQAYAEDGSNFRQIDGEAVMKRARERRNALNTSRVKRLPSNNARRAAAYSGTKKGIIILVNFSDKKFASGHEAKLYNRIANEEGLSMEPFYGSMRDYFKDQSQGQFVLDFDVVGPVTVSKKQSYYGKNDSEGNDMYAGEMVCEAVKLAANLTDNWAQYDWDGDGYVDQVYVVYAGNGEADGGGSNTIWPHAYMLSEAKLYGDGTGAVSVGGKKVDTYACGPELDAYYEDISGIGVMCHEFSHCLGYPDFYDTDYSGGKGMYCWDLMDQGSYNAGGYQPAGYTSYERWVAGWMEPIKLEDENVSVSNMKGLQKGGESYIIYNKRNRNEYYLLENREQTAWDAALPGSGLLIIHVDYSASAWENNTPNDDPSHQRMTWVTADNRLQTEIYDGQEYYTDAGLKTDPYPYGSNNKFNKDSKPAASLFSNNSNGTKYLDSSVEHIKRNNDGTISFDFVAQYTSGSSQGGGEDPVTPDVENTFFYESFNNCAGKGGNDDDWSSSVASSSFLPDNSGWIYTAGYGGYQCARFGSSKKSGMVSTPTFDITGDTQLSFNAAAWGNDGTTLTIEVLGDAIISPSTFEMKSSEWTSFKANLSGSGSIRLTFTPSKRFFLDEVLVAPAEQSTGIATFSAHSTATGRIYTLDGRYLGTDLRQLQRGLYIINGRKVVR